MPKIDDSIDKVRSSRAGHTFHERWAARRALQLIFPKDRLFAIAVEGISSTETANPGAEAEDVADLVLYYGEGNEFASCDRQETVQFKYKERGAPVTASYLKKTIVKFCGTLVGYEKKFSRDEVEAKLSFSFVTTAEFSDGLWEAIEALQVGRTSADSTDAEPIRYLMSLCKAHKVEDSRRLFSRIDFRAGEKSLPGQSNTLRRILTDWSSGADGPARLRLFGLQELILKKAGPGGQNNNLIRREDVLDALDCEPEDLFPADTRFIDVGAVVERAELRVVGELVRNSTLPVFVHAEGGVGKTVFIQGLAARLTGQFEVVVFDCFGGGAYRSEDQARHLPTVGLVQIANELASRGLCDPLLPGDSDRIGLVKAARKRFAQAAKAVREQSNKSGILIVIDAADNAQLEADNRKQDAFPKLLLSSLDNEALEGVKLLLTARTHRMPDVVGRTKVEPFELGPFSEAEARQFLEDRRKTLSNIEFITAVARSGRNARVLDYLVQTWESNVRGNAPKTPITVREIIAQRCDKIFADLRIAGWRDAEVVEFFAALSLLPPPIPLEELATALGWPKSQVSTAAGDLVPMLELVPHGAIFRDEPTESYVREQYSRETAAQQAIAERLLGAQSTSAYAAEALPHFLVVIDDSDRAFALADSNQFPTTIQSDFGRRRLTLARLNAAFRLAVNANDIDRVLGLTMRLSQIAAANVRGDQFIRRSPALATMLGDPDAYRRLFNDRSGWRGARNARLTVAHGFAGEEAEALIQRESTIRWIRWHWEQAQEEGNRDRQAPSAADLAAVFFQCVLAGEYGVVDRNLSRWDNSFSVSVSREIIELLNLYERHSGDVVLDNFIGFASSEKCNAFALKVSLLARQNRLSAAQAKLLARAAAPTPKQLEVTISEVEDEPGQAIENDAVQAALTALLFSSRAAAGRILSSSIAARPSSYEYGERYGPSKAWGPILRACVRAWSRGKRVRYHHLLPSEVKVTRQAKAIESQKDLVAFLGQLRAAQPPDARRGRAKQRAKSRFTERERDGIGSGIGLVLALIGPIEDAVLTRTGVSAKSVSSFIAIWKERLRTDVHRMAERPTDFMSRTIGIGCARLLLRHADDVLADDAQALIELISNDRFFIGQKTGVLSLLAERSNLHDLAGRFARHIAEHIGKDDNVEQRGESYAELASSLVPMSLGEARHYYRQGLAQLDQMGGEDHDRIYSLLHYASVQRGGFVRPDLAQRMMNLCQTVVHQDSGKFGWPLFARAAAKSIGLAAAHKLLRWDDQDVADYSYGLPQLACFLAKNGALDARRGAVLVSICEDHGWHEWQVGDGLGDLLGVAELGDRRPILLTILNKLKAERPFGAWPSLWESILKAGDRFPGSLDEVDRAALLLLKSDDARKQDEFNSRNSSEERSVLAVARGKSSDAEVDSRIAQLVDACDPTSALAIDEALRKVADDKSLPYYARKRFLDGLVERCPFDDRLSFVLALCECSELEFDRTTDLIVASVALWDEAVAHLRTSAKHVVEKLFEYKGSELFDLRFSNVTRHISTLSNFCKDPGFVLGQVLRTVAREQLELDGDEWLQLATGLCREASAKASLDALETLLSGSSARMADEIGEGAWREEFESGNNQAKFIGGIIWHLLGDDDAYIRWAVARSLGTLADLGLIEEFNVLLDGFDQTEVAALVSPETRLSFQNSQQWFLMGLARAALSHPAKLRHLRPKLVALAMRPDIHVVHKLHIARCLEHFRDKGAQDLELDALREAIDGPSHGFIERDDWPAAVESKSGFSFDYDFAKSEVARLARLFGLANEAVTDAIAAEITKRWPKATSLNYFPGRDRYGRDGDERYEFYREHIQRHALFSAATTLVATLPIVKHRYDDADDGSPWADWLHRYDITFADGSWLSDRKDTVPAAAKAKLLGRRIGQQETLKDQGTLLQGLGLVTERVEGLVPIYGSWVSSDGVYVRIVSALSPRRGSIGRCKAFSKLSDHELWLPMFWDQGRYERRRSHLNPFFPFVWAPDAHGLGIDAGDKIAAQGPAGRPRLGIELTEQLGLRLTSDAREWYDRDGYLALRSQVWGNWEPAPGQRQVDHHNDGEILWAAPAWLDRTLSLLGKRLVYSIKFSKYGSTQEYDETTGVTAVFVGLRTDAAEPRTWYAKKASRQEN
ncbi:NACHT domain-containing protein [Mesorhizobium sp. M1339]|uniref:NACHT domain-containing protein n=1 Tax=unclassified Mesorhizobium TaxID=325217 RepID=UPI00333A1B45